MSKPAPHPHGWGVCTSLCNLAFKIATVLEEKDLFLSEINCRMNAKIDALPAFTGRASGFT
jgi:hypothetical protein